MVRRRPDASLGPRALSSSAARAQFYWREQGEDVAIGAAIAAIDQCLHEEPGPLACSKVADEPTLV